MPTSSGVPACIAGVCASRRTSEDGGSGARPATGGSGGSADGGGGGGGGGGMGGANGGLGGTTTSTGGHASRDAGPDANLGRSALVCETGEQVCKCATGAFCAGATVLCVNEVAPCAQDQDGGNGRLLCTGPFEQVCLCATGAYCLPGTADCATGLGTPCPWADGGPSTCDTCTPGTVCVKEQTIGGVHLVPNDAGACDPPRVVVAEAPGLCSTPPRYHCASIPVGCGETPSCTCAQSLCSGECTDASASLVQCLQRVP